MLQASENATNHPSMTKVSPQFACLNIGYRMTITIVHSLVCHIYQVLYKLCTRTSSIKPPPQCLLTHACGIPPRFTAGVGGRSSMTKITNNTLSIMMIAIFIYNCTYLNQIVNYQNQLESFYNPSPSCNRFHFVNSVLNNNFDHDNSSFLVLIYMTQ